MSKYTRAVEANLQGYSHESTGTLEGCEQCPSYDEPFFSWQSCDACGSSLGGDRYAAHARDEDGEIVHLDICVDCLQYLNYGDEPETWEG